MEKQQTAKPVIRFPEFTDNWNNTKLSELLKEAKKRNADLKYTKDEVLSVSGEMGIVNQIEHLGRSYAGVSVHQYHVVEVGDIVYTKSPLKANPYGIIKQNKKKAGIVSTLYAVYNVKEENAHGEFIEHYFSLDENTNRYLRPLVKKGAKNDMKISNAYVLHDKIFVPSVAEQKKITLFLNILEKKIEQLKQKKSLLEEYKKGVMQKVFSQELRFKDENGNEFPKWQVIKLSEVGKFYAGGDLDKLEYSKSKTDEYRYPIYANGMGEGIYGYATTFQYKSNCVTVSGRGNLGLANVRKQNFNAIVRLIVIEPKDFINCKFLEETINQIKFAIESTGVPQLTVPQIKTYKIPLPSLKEQEKIATFLSTIDDKISRTQAQIVNTQEYKKGLLQKMFV